ncbi:MAG TPA: GDSL-type esterase/lipase family protein [Puia sp.]|nr:GDSL-type esterase/lipase family protein [Puia sp.]
MRNSDSSAAGPGPGSRGRLWAFRLIAVLLPLSLLVIIELLLRLFGYGHDTGLFIRYPDDPRYYVMNKYAAERYFTDTVNETKGSIEPFLVDKPAGTFRIFVLGESTTAGYPYFHNGSFHRWLEFRLMHEYPAVHFEIINVSLTAVNSYTVLDFGRQVLAYQPDAVLVYTGHNEYYGALGVGSTSRIANSRWLVQTMLELRRLRLVQWLSRLWSGLGGSPATPDQRENLMQRMAADQRIALGSPAYAAGIRQFRENMEELCRITQAQGVPVFLSTVVSNEKDQHPFIGTGGADVSFAAGDSAWRAGEYATAKWDYVAARDADLLRFRAPSAIDSIIRVLAAAHSNVHLVDALARFEAVSPHGVVGRTTLLEHVHPNLYGYALLSDAFYWSFAGSHLLPPPADTMAFDSLLVKMPVTAVDSLNGAYTILMLKSRWPFNEPIPLGFKRGNSMPEQLAGGLAVGRIDWSEALNELYSLSMRVGDKRMALRAVEALSLDRPLNTSYALYAGRLCFELGDTSDAVFYFKQAYSVEHSLVNIRSLYLLYMKMDRPKDARPWLDSAAKYR